MLDPTQTKYSWFRTCEVGDTHTFVRPVGMDAKKWRNRVSVNKCYVSKASPWRKFSLRSTPSGDIVAVRLGDEDVIPAGRPYKDGKDVKTKSLKRLRLLHEQRARELELAERALGKDKFDLSAEATPEIEAVRARSRFQLKNTAATYVAHFTDSYPDWQKDREAPYRPAPYEFKAITLRRSDYCDIHPNPHIAMLALERVIASKLVTHDGSQVPVKIHVVTTTRFGKPFDTAVVVFGKLPDGATLHELV